MQPAGGWAAQSFVTRTAARTCRASHCRQGCRRLDALIWAALILPLCSFVGAHARITATVGMMSCAFGLKPCVGVYTRVHTRTARARALCC
jgi:hypothetical protein